MDGKSKGERWVYAGHSAQSSPFVMGKVGVWKHPWRRSDEPLVAVRDPFLCGQAFLFSVHVIEAGSGVVRFAAGEFSNGVWGFYVPEET